MHPYGLAMIRPISHLLITLLCTVPPLMILVAAASMARTSNWLMVPAAVPWILLFVVVPWWAGGRASHP